MKARMKRIIHIMGVTAALSVVLAVPTYAEGNTEAEEVLIEKQEAEEAEEAVNILQADAWKDKAAASVMTCANIRSEPTTESDRLGILPKAGVADVVEAADGWTKIQSGEIVGYIRNDLLVFGKAAKELYEETYGITGTVKVSNLRVREEASLESEQVDAYVEGEQVSLTGTEGEWYTVSGSDDSEAYMYADYIEIDEPEQTAITEEEYYAAQAEEEAAARQQEEAARQQEEAAAQQEETAAVSAGSGEIDILAAIIECEAGGESYEGKVAVGAVVLNRVNSGQFPNSISEVVYQSGQFTPVASGGFNSVLSRGARSDCYEAAQAALNGENPVGGCLYFNSGSGRGMQIGNQQFY